jgi:uncharacterized protein DUF3558
MPDRHSRLLPAVLAVALLTGCASATAGSPTAADEPRQTTSASPSPSHEPDRYGAPRVANPLDPTKFLSNPCTVIPPAQQPGLGFSKPGEADTTTALGRAAPSCDWGGEQRGSVAFLKANRNGLADLYRQNAISPWAYWEETSVEGYPAVFSSAADLRSRGICSLQVGLNDALVMDWDASGRPGSAQCDRAKQLAMVAVKTIKGAG